MSPTSPARKRARPRARKKRARPAWLAFWPLLLALLATPFAVRAASVLVLSGPGALRTLYPFVALLQAPGWLRTLAPEQRDTLAQWMLWAQFPVYGLVASLLGRWRGMLAGIGAAVLVHLAGLVGALAVSTASAP